MSTESPIAEGGVGSPVSLRDVAQLAGVSVATVSRVVSGSVHPVSARTRKVVLEAADLLSFEPNRLARALVTTRSQTIGVVVHDISDPYFGDIVRGLEEGIHAKDYRLFVASSDRNPQKELDYIRAFFAHQVDALILTASGLVDPTYQTQLEQLVARYRRRGGTVVVLSDHTLPAPRVAFDNAGAVTRMMEYLATRGHRHIAFLAGPPELTVSESRLRAYQAATTDLGLAVDPRLVANGHFSMRGGSAAVTELLERTTFTALLAANDLSAIGAIRGLITAGVAVPSQVSVAGIDDIPGAEYGPVPLTTLRVPTYEIGQRGANLVLRLLEGESPADLEVEGSIVERDSVAGVTTP